MAPAFASDGWTIPPWAWVPILLALGACAWLWARRGRPPRPSRSPIGPVANTRVLPERVIEDAADAILLLDREGKIRLWNRGAVETFGYSRAEAVGRSYDLILPEGTPLETSLVDALADPGAVRDLRTQRRRRDGGLVEVSLTRSKVRTPDGEAIGEVEVLRDITSQRVLDREMVLTEKMAAVGKIASKVVHEIRNPLGSINLNVDLLLDGLEEAETPEVEEAREILQTIKRETKRLSQITDEYLQFSRMPQPTGAREDLNSVILGLADFLRPELRRSGIRLVLNLDDDHPRVSCDGRLVRQVVLNLIRNAMEVVPPRSGQVMVVTKATRDAGEIEIDDNGPGIPQEILPRIFDPFFTTKQDGTGLGLAVVRQIVEEHGGSVSCSSVPDKGTTFRIRLPLAAP
ncbi:MAG: PAS domain S-box protein [Candidatus Eisenbacteria bacterium]|nr:PAS domain S-box protein [Candidatus Eisenbacteria bacterium]